MTLLYPVFLWFLLPLSLLFLGVKKQKLTQVGHSIILLLILLSLTRPVIKKGLQERSLHARDIIIALDVSYSMQAEDVNPTRYIFAKQTIEAFLKQNPKDNLMLIAFTTNPLLLSPPTTDHTLLFTLR